MTDLEISKALALAIGWKEKDFAFTEVVGVALYIFSAGWKKFDYRDWNIIGPIAAKFDGFPRQVSPRLWHACAGFNHTAYGDTPQKAIAMAVIGAMK